MNKQFFIFTDGSAIGNPGPAGWAAIVIHGTRRQEIAGSVPWSTVSEMELRAAVEALRLTPADARIELRSDSELLIHGMRFRVFRWRRYGWRNSRGFELQHQELWRALLLLNADRTIRWLWVKGHSGQPAVATPLRPTAATRDVHSTTPLFEWLMPYRLEDRAFAFHPLKGSVPGKREHGQQETAADKIRGCFSDRYPGPTQPSAAVLAAVTPNRQLHPLRSPYPRRS